MLKHDSMTRKEIAAFIEGSRIDPDDEIKMSPEQIKGWNLLLDYLIDEFSDKDLAYNTETGFFDYVGPYLPPIPVKRKR